MLEDNYVKDIVERAVVDCIVEKVIEKMLNYNKSALV
jgi:hypothetical protein